jgi:thermitase
MCRVMGGLRRIVRSRAGQSVTEYALLLAFFGLVAVTALSVLGGRSRAAMEKIAMAVQPTETQPLATPAAEPDGRVHAEAVHADARKPAPGEQRVLYKLKEGAAGAQLGAFNAVLQKYDLREDRKLIKDKVTRGKAMTPAELGPNAICTELRASGAVDFAEPDRLIAPGCVPNDPLYSSQWFHTTIGSPTAWDATVGSRSVIAAVCDTGVESTHPDLSANLRLPGYNSVDGSANTEPVMAHGTSVAGCIGAVGNNGTGVSGVNWTVSILPVRITNRSDGWAYYSDMASGIQWAADAGARVVNLSYDAASSSTVDYAAQYLRGKGGLLFIAAGNSGQDTSTTCPISPYSLVVGATESTDTLAGYSNYGTNVDLVAPGSSIYTTTTGGSYACVSGTSFASPVAAGVAALVFAANPSLTASQAENAILSTCADLGSALAGKVGHGRVNAAGAVAAAGVVVRTTPPTASAFASPSSGQAPLAVTLDGTGSSGSTGTIVSYVWDFGDGTSAQGAVVTHTYASAGVFAAKLTVTDNSGSAASGTVTVSVASAPTRAIHVGGIGMTALNNRHTAWASAAVLVVDAGGTPVAGAVVSGAWSGVVAGSSSGTTGSNGIATLTSNRTRTNGTATLTVTGVSGAGCTYAPAGNVATSSSVALTAR